MIVDFQGNDFVFVGVLIIGMGVFVFVDIVNVIDKVVFGVSLFVLFVVV